MLLDFWKGKNIRLIDSIASEMKEKVEQKSELEETLRKLVDEEDLPTVLGFVSSGKSRQTVNNLLVKQYGSKKAGELYKKIKPLLKEKKGK